MRLSTCSVDEDMFKCKNRYGPDCEKFTVLLRRNVRIKKLKKTNCCPDMSFKIAALDAMKLYNEDVSLVAELESE